MQLFKNTASQKIRVFAFADAGHATLDAGEPVTGDALNITAQTAVDNAALGASNDPNPDEVSNTNAPGVYEFDPTQAETNGDVIEWYPKSSTAGVQVVTIGGNVQTLLPPNHPDMGIETDGHVHGDVKEWLGTAPAALTDTDKVQASLQHGATAVITAELIAADAIGSSELATTAVNEIRDAVTGGAYALDTDANGRVRVVDGTGAGEINTATGRVGVNLGDVAGVLGNANVGWVDANDRVDVGSWLGTAVTTSATTAKPEVDVFGVSDNAATADNLQTVYDGDEGFAGAYAGPNGPGVYCDDAAANTNTTVGVDGTWNNPVSTLGAARTIADALNIKCYYILGRSSFTLTATHQDWNFIGLGGFNDNTLNLGTAASPTDVDGSVCHRLKVVGTMAGSDRLVLVDCAIDDAPAAEVTTINVLAVRCTLEGDFALDSSADHVFDQCVSGIAGNSAPVVTFNASGGSAMFRSYSGGIELKSLVASNTVSVETDGQVIFNADCNVNATVVCRGMMTITDNTAGMASLTTDAVYDKRADIAAILVDTADMQPKLGTPAGADMSADIAAVKAETALIVADTNELQTDWADGGRLDVLLDAVSTHSAADVWTSVTRTLTAATNITSDASAINTTSGVVDSVTTVTTTTTATNLTTNNDKTGYSLVATGADLVLCDGRTLPNTLEIIAAAVAGRISGAGTGTETFLGMDEATTRVVVTVDGSGNRTDIVYS